MNKPITLVIFFLGAITFFLLPSCGDDLETITNTTDLGYTEKYQRRKTDFAREGWTEITAPDGILIEKAHYKHDTLDGLRILYYENGDTNIVETYRQGVFDGTYSLYYENGQIKQQGEYVNNEMTGDWLQYHENGQLKEKVQFEHNVENGPFVEYHKNGKIAAEGHYADGDNEEGILKIYNEQGILSKIMQCEHGRCTTTWSLDEEKEATKE